MSEGEKPRWSKRFPIELLSPNEMAEADRLASLTVPSLLLMERAGAAVAREALALLADRSSRRVLVLCGPGSNGGDGYVVARLLDQAGCRVTVASLGARSGLKGDAAEASAQWTGDSIGLAGAPLEEADLIVDALFGAGLSRDIDGVATASIEKVNAWRHSPGGLVLAVDIPSGIDGASGAVRGIAVEATHTATFVRLKPGHILMPGRLRCGAIGLHQIGIESAVLGRIGSKTWLNDPRLWRHAYPVPNLESHKYARGHAVVVSGPISQTGAARLCARGALRAGAGLVTVATTAEALPVLAQGLIAVMTRVAEGPAGLGELLEDARKNVVALGPGLGVGASTRALVGAALKPVPVHSPPRRVVLDADALTSFAGEPHVLFKAIADSRHDVVLTPHDGEFDKLFGGLLDVSQAKPARARAAAALSGAIVVIKGPDTVVAHPDGRATIAASEAPWLATAGSGDVLAGMIAGLLAQGMAPFEASAAAVWIHAEAARRFGAGLIAEDIPENIPPVLADLLSEGAIEGN